MSMGEEPLQWSKRLQKVHRYVHCETGICQQIVGSLKDMEVAFFLSFLVNEQFFQDYIAEATNKMHGMDI